MFTLSRDGKTWYVRGENAVRAAVGDVLQAEATWSSLNGLLHNKVDIVKISDEEFEILDVGPMYGPCASREDIQLTRNA
jgi:hypothetical protein